MQVRIKKLKDNAVIPSYAKAGDAGMDLTATDVVEVNKEDHGYIRYNIGLAVEIPEGYVGYIFPRSSISDTGLILSNCVGVIDSGFRGELQARFKWIPGTKKYEAGDRVAQMIIMPYPTIEFVESEELTETIRGEGGHGSSGK